MQQVTEEQILSLAPNPKAAANGKKIASSGGFVSLQRSEDDTFYMGECSGSGKSNYITSADYINEAAPVFRCSCPSRQFPCKHSLALLYEMAAGKDFSICAIPEDIIKKREKKQARDEKAAQDPDSMTPEEKEKAAKKKAASAKSAKTARLKKIKKQIEGLELTEKLVTELVSAGLGTMGGTTLTTYSKLSKQLGDYYLPGPQKLLNGLILEITQFQKDGEEIHYDNAIEVLEKLWNLVKKSKEYLQQKVEQEDVALEDTILYEELGGIWKLSELEELGKCRENAELMQLSFWVTYDEAGKQYIDSGCFVDRNTGELFMHYNYRPVKSLKYIKQEDTLFSVAQVPKLMCYPGEGNPRIRWEGAILRETTPEDFAKVQSYAMESISTEAKNIKNILKNPMAEPMVLGLIAYHQIGKLGDDLVLETKAGDKIYLRDREGMEKSVKNLKIIPDDTLLENQVLLAAFYYHRQQKRLFAQPLTIITEDKLVRLLY
ncbi:MAG: SWIM zinc finger family protein [Lachnospiraceae bacterium]|nr:SWIM zinc finger family protein [Lachnospiraceae bacterium]